MKIIEVKDYGFRRVVRVVVNFNDPEAVHADGTLHTGDPTAAVVAVFQAEFGRVPAPWEWCRDCAYNWKEPTAGKDGQPIPSGGFTWTGEELLVGINKWGNPIHDDQKVVSTRLRTWDELYREIDDRLGTHVTFGDAPRQAAPALVPEVELDFELIVVGDPYVENGLAKLRYRVLRRGQPKLLLMAEGEDSAGFNVDRDAKYAQAQRDILAVEQSEAEVQAIVNS